MWAMKYLALFILLICSTSSNAREYERHYQDEWCKAHAGQTEVIQADRTRVDCITYYHAIEFDFQEKWAEAIGQALHYAIMTGKRGGIVLIGDDRRYTDRAINIIEVYSLPIDLWIISE